VDRKKKLGDESLDWIKDTKESSPKTSMSKKEVKGKSKSKRLGVLKQYVSKETEVEKIKPEKESLSIPDDSATIVKMKKDVEPKKKEIREEISAGKKIIAMRGKKILSYPISRFRNTANGISDNFLSGIWLTGVTIGLVKKSADKIKKSIIRS